MEDNNEYEQERLKIIAENEKLLTSLGLNGFSSNAPSSRASSSTPASKRKAPANGKHEPTKKKAKIVAPPPARLSMRLRGQQAKTEEDVQAIEEFNANLEKENQRNRYLAKKIRKPVMELGEMVDEEEDEKDVNKIKDLQTVFHDLSLKDFPRPSGMNRDYDDLEPASAAAQAADLSLRQLYGKVRYIDEVKATAGRSYSLIVHPEKTKCLVISGDKRGQLGIWDADANVQGVADEDEEDSPTNNVWRVQAHQASAISCLRWNPVNSQTLYTASYDCSLRRFDLATATSTEVYSTPDVDALFNQFDLTPDGNQVWLSDSDGGMNHLDMREGKHIRRRYVIAESPSAAGKKVGGFSINPVEPWLVCSAHNDRNMRIWDLRHIDKVKMQPFEFEEGPKPAEGIEPPHDSETYPTQNCEWDAISEYEAKKPKARILRARAPHGLSCSAAFWDMSGKRILTTSYDDRIRVWDANPSKFVDNSPTRNLTEVWQARHDTQVGRWVTVFKAQWSPYADIAPHIMVGNMKRRLTILSGLTGSVIGDFSYNTITAVPAVHAMHPNRPGTVLGANASGKVMRFAVVEDE
ncbi:hypothetical protein FFLO_04993 [Filobasidium floriforme]|uniref:DNA damage-binding protein CMR1 n=1 Tax=Filobasidium floriforme TaxID=5210 RepID=A0A8K0JJW7_9TREE|nr:hypothetical protein FFLO_04993 [Filobasidium floriforme]